MDSSEPQLVKEECSSSESGWTTYIASPMEEDDDYSGEYDFFSCNNQNGRAAPPVADDEGSDDSTSSDAASGPNHRYKCENAQAAQRTSNYKHNKGSFNHNSLTSKPSKKGKGDDKGAKTDRRIAAYRKYSK